MAQKMIGVAITGQSASEVLRLIEQSEEMGIPAAWLTTSRAGRDALTLFAAAAVRTQRIFLGTALIPTWPRHPVAVAQQVQVLAALAPGRFRLGIGPSHKVGMESVFGVDFQAPLGHLREYVVILKTLLQGGSVDFQGRHYRARARIDAPADVPVMASALRRGSFELCGAEADGAITWVCPGPYLARVALPAMRKNAQEANRPMPSLVVHAPVCVDEDFERVRIAMREQLGGYPANPFYTQMFVDAGFPEAAELKDWSDAMINAVALWGSESRVNERLLELFHLGASEVIVSPVLTGDDRTLAMEHTLGVVAEASG